MPAFDRQLAIAFGTQSAEGTPNSSIAGLSGSLTQANGIVLGDAGSGLVESGITHSFSRRFRDKGPVSGGFTALGSDFLEGQIALSFAFPMAGPRITTQATPVDGDFFPPFGVNALLQACGLIGGASGTNPTVGWKYTAGNVAIATAKLFDSGGAWVIRDIRGNWSLDLSPGQVAIMTCQLSGIVDSYGAVAFPTLDYGEQASISAPSVAGVSPSWGISDEVRGWTSLTLSGTNDIEEIDDSASSTGKTIEQTGRTIGVSMTMKDTDTDLDFTRSELVQTSTPTEDLKATVGTPATGSDVAEAFQIEASNIEVQSYTPDVAGTKAASTIEGRCTGTTDGGEFFLAFL